jgi:hypothetical protein
LTATIGDLNGDGYGDLVLTFVHGPALVGVWSGAVLTRHPNTPANQLPMMAAFLALPSNVNGAGLTTRNVNNNGRVELVVTSADTQNPGAAHCISPLRSSQSVVPSSRLKTDDSPSAVFFWEALKPRVGSFSTWNCWNLERRTVPKRSTSDRLPVHPFMIELNGSGWFEPRNGAER